MNFNDVCAIWNNERLPIINGIINSDGYIDNIHIDFDENNNCQRILVKGGRCRIESFFLEKASIGFTNILIYDEITNHEKNIKIYCGGGGYGGEGFIVAESIDLGVKWIAYFEESNEFLRCEINGNTIIAYNNCNEKWTFDIDIPSNLIFDDSQKIGHRP